VTITGKDTYITDPKKSLPLLSRIFSHPAITLYPQVLRIIWTNSRKAIQGRYDGDAWASSSLDILRALENAGVRFRITGMDHLRGFEGPAVFIGNHMSTLETLVLPCIIQPLKTATFVVKKSLVDARLFGPVMRSRDPVLVGRVNPREDLKTVLTEGSKKIESGFSIVIFPQSTRSIVFNPEEFNSLGIKLAVKAGVPVVPLALKTDAWGIGKIIKDFGPLDRSKKVFFSFGEPMTIKGRGTEEHQRVIAFIQDNLARWAVEDENRE
jgi:1-acyl-sn-glycerol-3-phosphate acyltransferase